MIDGLMTFGKYQALANRTGTVVDETLVENLNHAVLGLCTEVGEFATEVKRMKRYGKKVTDEMRSHMAEELGDTLWYIAIAAEALGIPMGQMATENIEKLQKRFPEKYSNEAAEARADKGGLAASES